MQLLHSITLIGAVYHVQIGLGPGLGDAPSLTPREQEAIRQFGAPVIDCGGTFGSGEGSFDLPTDERQFPSGFPIKQLFSTQDYEDAAERATLFRSTVRTRIVDGMAGVMTMTPGTTGTVNETINPLD